MPWTVIQNVRRAIKYRGGIWGLVEHMYTNGDYPFKMGTYMGCDAAGNRYYENRVDYPFGQHRWVEPGDINNFESTQVPPEWHGWLMHYNDVTPTTEEEYIAEKLGSRKQSEISHAPYQTNIGHQEPIFNFNNQHNQSQIRSRGYGIGNPIVNLPPHVPDAYYTQPGSPYNDASIRKFPMIGDLDIEFDVKDGKGRPYKNELWKQRLMTYEEKNADAIETKRSYEQFMEKNNKKQAKKVSPREAAILARGGTLSG